MKNVFMFLLITWATNVVIAQGITIDNINKKTSFSGDKIIISGSGFSDNSTELKVSFGAVAGTILSSSNFLIEVSVPTGTTYDNIIISNLITGLSAGTSANFLLAFGGENFETAKLSPIIEFNGGNGLYDLCLCDFNNDQKSDIATSNESSSLITILKNTRSTTGQIQFSSISSIINSKTQNIQCADLNNDGKPEIILSKTGTVSNIVLYLKNTSSGGNISFDSPVLLNLDGSTARRVEVADLDLDGKPEIIVSNQSNNKVNIFKNISSPSNIAFNPTPITLVVAGISNSSGLKVKDLNNDKYPDIVITPFLSSNVYVLENQSSTNVVNFKEATSFSVSGNIVNIAIGNLNNDQKPDIIVTKLTTSNISLLPNTSIDKSSISFGAQYDVMTAERPWGVDLGDLNGDGKLDISIASINESSRYLNIFINKSTNASFSFDKYDVTTNEKARNIKIGDIDGNGKPDLVFTGIGNNKISIISNEHCLIPQIFGENNRTFCDGSELSLSTSGAPDTNFKWYKNDGASELMVKDSNEPFYTEIVSVPGNFTYRVVASNGTCLSNSPNSISVEVINGAIAALTGITPLAPICEGSDFTLQAQGDFTSLPASATFVWTKPDNTMETTSTPNLSITNVTTDNAGLYTVEINAGPCVSNAVNTSVQIISTSNTDITASAGLSFCVGQFTTLTVPQVTSNTYQWFKNGLAITGGGDTYKIDITESGEYTIRIITTTGCEILPTAVTVNVYQKPTADFIEINQVCTSQEVIFTNTSNYNIDIATSFLWDFGDNQTSSEESPTHIYGGAGDVTVTLTISYDSNCTDTYQQDITISDADNIRISTDGPTILCSGDDVVLSVPEGSEKYLWDDTESNTTPSITVTESGIYSVDVTNINGCISTAEIEIEVQDILEISIDVVTNQGKIQLVASGGIRYEWTEDNTLFGSDLANPVVTPESTTTYFVTGFDNNGCSNTAEITVEINTADAVSKVFTPNNDGENDLWVIKNVGQFSDCTILVFNRSGQVVYEKKNYANDWDGTFKGKDLQEGVYYYIVKCENNNDNSLTGSVTIFR